MDAKTRRRSVDAMWRWLEGFLRTGSLGLVTALQEVFETGNPDAGRCLAGAGLGFRARLAAAGPHLANLPQAVELEFHDRTAAAIREPLEDKQAACPAGFLAALLGTLKAAQAETWDVMAYPGDPVNRRQEIVAALSEVAPQRPGGWAQLRALLLPPAAATPWDCPARPRLPCIKSLSLVAVGIGRTFWAEVPGDLVSAMTGDWDCNRQLAAKALDQLFLDLAAAGGSSLRPWVMSTRKSATPTSACRVAWWPQARHAIWVCMMK